MGKYSIQRLIKGIVKAVREFELNLSGRFVLTEAATGNYVVTPIIAAVAGAEKVYAFTRNSVYGSVEEVERETYSLAKVLEVENRILVVKSFDIVDFSSLSIVTNTGFLRPITGELIEKLSSKCVIPLMYEPWEFREGEIDLNACCRKGIKVYGTNESDERLRTMEYIGFVVLYFLLDNKFSPFNSRVLVIGSMSFVNPTFKILVKNGYPVDVLMDYGTYVNPEGYDVIVILEHQRDVLIVGKKPVAFIDKDEIRADTLVVHICGNVDFSGVKFEFVPRNTRPFGYMSVTADFIDAQAIIDLHTAGLKVAEGMLRTSEIGLRGLECKLFMERNYPALAFDEPCLW